MTRAVPLRHRCLVPLALPVLSALIVSWGLAPTLSAAPPEPAPALERGRAALAGCSDALRRQSGGEAAALADEAEAAFDDARAEDPLEAALGLAQTLLQCRIGPAPMMEKVALTARIEQHLTTVLDLDPDHLEAHHSYGVLLAHLPPFLNRSEEAVGHLRRVLEVAPTPAAAPPEAYLFLSRLHRDAGRSAEAEEVRRAGLAAHPGIRSLAEEPAPAGEPPAVPGPEKAEDPEAAAGAEPDDPRRRLLETALAPAVPGLAVGLARGDEVLLLDGFGSADLENAVPMTADHVLRIGSVSKQFLAVLTLRLAEAGRLSPDDPVGQWLPAHAEALAGIRIRQLLTHTAGLPRDAVGGADWLSRSLALPRPAAPGARHLYSNLGYAVLGLVVEAAGGGGYPELLRDQVLDAAGLTATAPCDERAVVPRRAQGYAWRAGTLTNDDPVAQSPELLFAGGLCSTARDLLRWLRVLHGGALLTEGSYRELTTPPKVSDRAGTTYAAGLQTVDGRGGVTYRHGGAVSGFLAETAYRPADRTAVVVLVNAEAGEAADPRRLAAELLETEDR